MAHKYPDFVKSTGYGTVDGLCGANCRHSFDPFIPGFSTPNYTDEELAKMNEQENTPVEFNGKSYTKYEATQRQRALERTLSAKNQTVQLLRLGGASDEDIQIAEVQYRNTSHEYARFSKAMGLPQQRERVTLKNIEKSLTSKANGGIIKSKEVTQPMINAIEKPIEQQHTGKGNPNAILMFDTELNNRQKNLLEQLPEFDSRIIVPKDTVNMPDLSALTAKTGHEFAMFTKGNERLIIRGSTSMVNINIEMAEQLAKDGYKWSGHTHPGIDYLCMQPSDGDYAVLECFNQKNSVIYNSKGDFRTFEKRSEYYV